MAAATATTTGPSRSKPKPTSTNKNTNGAVLASPPSSLGGATTTNHHNNKNNNNNKPKRKSTLRVMTEILCVLLICELYFYHKLTLREFQEMEERAARLGNGGDDDDAGDARMGDDLEFLRSMKKPVAARRESPELLKHMREVRKQFQGGGRSGSAAAAARMTNIEKANEEKRSKRRSEKETEKLEYLALLEKHSKAAETDPLTNDRLKTAKKLAHMQLFTGYDLEELPPWSQIEKNFGIPFVPEDENENAAAIDDDDEPIILGLEHCAAFREAHDPELIAVGPAGLFSTGTNLINSLTRTNCRGPANRTGLLSKFALVQVPYGKHNPADARFYHQVKHPRVADRTAVLPVVAIRHPYTWMSAMCRHSYQTRWRHVPHKCWESLFLKNPVVHVPWGFKRYNDTHNVTNSYQSLAHMWLEWYKPYFLAEEHNQTPRLMVRHEDMVYRPEKVIEKICGCVGGTNNNPNPDWGHPEGFEYEEESANKGKGHGKHGRSGLLTAVIKYATPLEEWYSRFTASDRLIMKEAFSEGPGVSPELARIFETFGYKLFHDADLSEPTEAEKRRNREDHISKLKPNETRVFEAQQRWTDGPPARRQQQQKKKRLPDFFG